MKPLISLLTTYLGSDVASSPPGSRAPAGKLGAVASESDICSRIGTDLLQAGGNAADALVGTVFCVGVLSMYHSGIGGGGFMVVRAPNGSTEAIDFREAAPAAAFEEMFVNNTEASRLGGLASGVPGEVKGLAYLHENYGSLPWRQVMAPAIEVARCGFPVTEDTVRYMDAAVSAGYDFLVEDPNWAVDFAPQGRRVELHEDMTRERYARTLQQIAEHGPDTFYAGEMANATIAAVQSANGTMTLEDLLNYDVEIYKSVDIDYRGFKLHSCGAPASGAVALSIMKIIEGYEDIGDAAQTNLSTHRLDEAMKFAYAQRMQLGDPAFVEGMSDYEAMMLAGDTAAAIRGKILDDRTQNASFYDPDGFGLPATHGTSHVVTADASGLAISLTSTINLLFGSTIMVPETGIIMNNEMNDFSTPGTENKWAYKPTPSNYVRPGKRPLSSIAPVIVVSPDGSLHSVTGAAGGSRIITSTVQALINLIDRGESAEEALAAPRLHDQLHPEEVQFENSYDPSTVAFMAERGHNVTFISPATAVQALRRLRNGTFDAAGDPRQKASAGFTI
ncbi:gamma-glutamyltranspeptidase-like protein [Lineolata rhizophorae]|uniref:Glutathione hydrolase n=1 Tax=Lineolata rhizophorae TaxID=578093 RepID=A0A6A6NZ22_9PEZI|nr:gamma-glutamyltranspeptidase-like protein [Lineolata rhizophorae]